MLYIPKKTIQTIIECNQHYVAQVKANQPTLHQNIQAHVEIQPLDSFLEEDSTHGRRVTRITQTFTVTNETIKQNWSNIQTYIIVHRTRLEKGKTSYEKAFFISDLSLNAQAFHQIIRQHWRIENKLHWVKDVIHKEDKNRIRTGTGPVSASVFSSIAINIHRKINGSSITNSQILFRANVKELFNIIRT
jgi:predicted transposase YbfD/YdcC